MINFFRAGDLVRFGDHDRLLIYVSRTLIGFEKLRSNRKFKGNLSLYGIYELRRCPLLRTADEKSIAEARRAYRKYLRIMRS